MIRSKDYDREERMGPPTGLDKILDFKDGLPVILDFKDTSLDVDLTVSRVSPKVMHEEYQSAVKSMVYADRLRVMQDSLTSK